MTRRKRTLFPLFVLVFSLFFTSCGQISGDSRYSDFGRNSETQELRKEAEETESIVAVLPEYSGEPYTIVDNNEPDFSDEELQNDSYEIYSPLDHLGRCRTAKANIGEDLMPTEDRESISEVKPSGWMNKEYDEVDGGYLYNRCHLIGFQLTAENANERNLITGTRYMNTEGCSHLKIWWRIIFGRRTTMYFMR